MNPKVHYRIYKSLPKVPTLRQFHPLHYLAPYFFKIHIKIILPTLPTASMWLEFFDKRLYIFINYPMLSKLEFVRAIS